MHMHRWRRSRFAIISTVVLAAVFVVLTLLLPTFGPLDDALRGGVVVDEATRQLLTTVGLVATVVVVLAGAAVLAWWVSRRRLYAVSGALVLGVTLTWASSVVLQELIAQPRPGPGDLLALQDFSYPSTHVALWTAMAFGVATVRSTARHRVRPVVLVGAVLVVAQAAFRLLVGGETLADVLAGAVLGALVASLANLIADVHIVREPLRAGTGSSAAVIYNPVKVSGVDAFRDLVGRALAEYGFDEPLWITTSAEDPGVAMAREALAADVDLVLVAGGDGTVRIALGELADTGQKVAILPSGTGNLLARNLRIPLDLERALLLALSKPPTPTDIIEVRIDGRTEYAAVLAGLGIDANIMKDTNEDLKKTIGTAAYVVAGARHIKAKPMAVALTVDDADPVEVEASLVSIGNVGELQEGVTIMPDASAHDGRLDVLVATPNTTLDMAQMITDVLFETGDGQNIARYAGERLHVRVEGKASFQIDGDVVGEAEEATFTVRPGAVQLVTP